MHKVQPHLKDPQPGLLAHTQKEGSLGSPGGGAVHSISRLPSMEGAERGKVMLHGSKRSPAGLSAWHRIQTGLNSLDQGLRKRGRDAKVVATMGNTWIQRDPQAERLQVWG